MAQAIQSEEWLALWEAVKSNNLKSARDILERQDTTQRMALLVKKGRCADTVLHLSACQGHGDIFRLLVDSLSATETLESFNVRCGCASSPLQRAANNGHTHIVKYILGSVDQRKRENLLAAQNSRGDTALHRAAWNGHFQTIVCMLEFLSCERRLQILTIKNQNGDTFLHEMVSNSHADATKQSLASMDTVDRIQLLNTRNENSLSIFHLATKNGHVRLAGLILDLLPSPFHRLAFVCLHVLPKKHRQYNDCIRLMMSELLPDSHTVETLQKLYHKDKSATLTSTLDKLHELLKVPGRILSAYSVVYSNCNKLNGQGRAYTVYMFRIK